MQEIKPARVEIAARRHARQGPDEMVFEDHGAFGQAVEIQRRQGTAIGRKRAPVQAIEQNED
jgi:hypothetical protein